MIDELDILIGETGKVVLVVPGDIPAGRLSLQLYGDYVTLAAGEKVFATVRDVPAESIAGMARLSEMGLLEVTDPDAPPTEIRHWATIQDNRE